MENGQYVPGSFWFYAPNKGAPIAFAIFFAISGVWHLYQCYLYKSTRITGVYPWSALLFVIGYILREVGAFDYSYLEIFVASTVFLYAAPPAYELSNYLVLSRVLHYVPYYSPIHPSRVFKTFLGVSTIIEALTVAGGVNASNSGSSSASSISTGKILLKVTLILQICVLLAFVFLAGRFHYNCRKGGMLGKAKIAGRNPSKVLVTLYLSTALIFIRTVYRTAEYFETAAITIPQVQQDSALLPQSIAPANGVPFDPQTISVILRYEWFFWVFEAMLMLTNSVLLNFRHPGKYLPPTMTKYLGKDGLEREGEHFEDKRSGLVKFVDPFDVVGMVRGRDKKWWLDDEVPMGEPSKVEGEK